MTLSDALKNQVRQCWTEQLYREFDSILFFYRVSLRPPLIRIEDLKGKWGTWDSVTRTITLSSTLIENHSWDVVIEILKHEVAHQLVCETYGHDHTHGDRFVQACKKLGVAAWAARASGELPTDLVSWKERVFSQEEERLLKRVEKLLSLATSTNEHEALLAMQRVQEIYARYNLERMQSHRDSLMVSLRLGRKRKRTDATESMICSILTEHFFVRVIFGSLYDPQDLQMYKSVEVLGTRENVLMAEYVYEFLSRKVEHLWGEYKDSTGHPTSGKKSYILGVLVGFRDKLTKSKAKHDVAAEMGIGGADSRALVALADQQLEEYVATRYPRLVSRSWGRGRHDPSSFAAGKVDGERITLNKGITKSHGRSGLLLG